jgi:hypothetical protein
MKASDGVEKKVADVLHHNNVTDEDENFILSEMGVYIYLSLGYSVSQGV